MTYRVTYHRNGIAKTRDFADRFDALTFATRRELDAKKADRKLPITVTEI